MNINIPLGLSPVSEKYLLKFNQGSSWRRFWPILILTNNYLYIAVWFRGEYRKMFVEWRRTRLSYWVQQALAKPMPKFPYSIEVEVAEKPNGDRI